jgi:hypothetical protein
MNRWMAHRQAYFPRPWPLLVGSGVFVVLDDKLVVPPVWAAIAFGALVGAVVLKARLWIWERRHPMLTPEEYVALRREGAQWN